jgi:hypothetical protein
LSPHLVDAKANAQFHRMVARISSSEYLIGPQAAGVEKQNKAPLNTLNLLKYVTALHKQKLCWCKERFKNAKRNRTLKNTTVLTSLCLDKPQASSVFNKSVKALLLRFFVPYFNT